MLDFVGDADAGQLQGGSEARGGTHRGPCWSRAQALRSLGLELGRWMIMGPESIGDCLYSMYHFMLTKCFLTDSRQAE